MILKYLSNDLLTFFIEDKDKLQGIPDLFCYCGENVDTYGASNTRFFN